MPERSDRGHVLVVEDDDGVRRLFVEVLRHAGYATAQAATFGEAVGILAQGTPEVICILVDDHLPDGRGIELVRRVRSEVDGETVPVIIVTGDDDPSAEIEALQAGASDHLRKPVGPESLVARVASHLRDRAAWLTMLDAAADRRALASSFDRLDVDAVIDAGSFRPVFQPIVDLSDGRRVGYEALTRFDDGNSPDRWFAEATVAGLGPRLELVTLEAAIEAASGLPGDAYLSVNVTPRLLSPSAALVAVLERARCPVVLEITEREAIDDYDAIRSEVAALRPTVRLSIDDTGAGFASLRHVLLLEPDFVKLDRTWISGIDTEPAKQAMVAGLVHFAETTGCQLIAEGVETEPEQAMLVRLGVRFAQGFLLGEPGPAQ